MSHSHERSEKICLNCGTALYDRYCHKCGQENVEPKENFWQLTSHFLQDFTHFDGKFFTTIKDLLFRPGFLTDEYLKGKRASHLNPIRMYLFISAAFFLLYMSFFVPKENIIKLTKTESKEEQKGIRKTQLKAGLSKIFAGIDSLTEEETFSPADTGISFFSKDEPQTYHEYDSLQKTLPRHQRDGSIERYFTRKAYATSVYARDDPKELIHKFREKFYHSLPYMFFISLPLIALLLRLLYIRRKQFFYVSHAIFTIHLYCAVFLLYLIHLSTKTLPGNWRYISLLPLIALFIYIYKAMRRFYKQKRFKTVVKFFLFLSMGGTIIGLLALVFLIKSFLGVG